MRNFREKNYYELLMVERGAPAERIKRAYVELARIYHPDSKFYTDIIDEPLTPEQLEYFKHVTMAYNCLSNPEERARYDAGLPPELKEWEAPVSSAHSDSRPRASMAQEFGRPKETSAGESSEAIPEAPSVSVIIRRRRKTWWRALNLLGLERP